MYHKTQDGFSDSALNYQPSTLNFCSIVHH